MPTMFPVSHNSDPNDPNRRIDYWQPGDGIPGTAKTAFVLLLISSIGLLYSGDDVVIERPVVDDAERWRTSAPSHQHEQWVGGRSPVRC